MAISRSIHTANCGHKGEAKQHVTAWCHAQGYEVKSHDAADATLTWLAVQRATLADAVPA